MKHDLPIRVTIPILAVSMLLLAVGVVAGWYVHRLDRFNSEILENYVASLRAARNFDSGLQEIRKHLDTFLLAQDRQGFHAISEVRWQTNNALGAMSRLAHTEVERDLVSRIDQGYRRFWQDYDALSSDFSAARLARDMDQVLKIEILMPDHEYLNFNMTMIRRTSVENQWVADLTVASLLVLGCCGAAAGLLAGFTLARRFRRSIVQLSLPIRDVAGRLNSAEPFTHSARWGFQELESAFRHIADHVRTVVDQLQESQREVLRAEQLAAVGQLAAGLAHELRNPLSSIKILVQSATDQGKAGAVEGRDLAVLEEEIIRLERLVQTFLDFARPPKLQKAPFDVRRILQQTMDLVAARAKSQRVQIQCQLPDEPVDLVADDRQLRQVVLNLLLNALDVLGSGGTIWIDIATRRGDASCGGSDTPGGRLAITVADNGTGLPANLGARIFEPFVSTKESGLGLGLSICQRIVEAHDGFITAAGRPEGGSVFTVEVPLAVTLPFALQYSI